MDSLDGLFAANQIQLTKPINAVIRPAEQFDFETISAVARGRPPDADHFDRQSLIDVAMPIIIWE
jgi:hypothetical protein